MFYIVYTYMTACTYLHLLYDRIYAMLCFINEHLVNKFCSQPCQSLFSIHDSWVLRIFVCFIHAFRGWRMWESPSPLPELQNVPPTREYRNSFWGKGSQINLNVWVLRKLLLGRNSTPVLKKKINSVTSHLWGEITRISRDTEDKSHIRERIV